MHVKVLIDTMPHGIFHFLLQFCLAHTVSEAARIRITKILMNLREGEDARLEFPTTLTNTERKFIHELASQLGLVSKSTGKGENRHIVVTKRAETKKKTGDEESMPVLNIGKSGINILKQHISKFPLSKEEENESKETGSSLVNAILGNDGNDDEQLSNTLNRLGLGVAKGANIVQPREKRVDLERRRSRHAFFQQQKTANAQQYQKAIASRSRLPAYSRQQEIVATVAANPVVVIQGETGCGKSTQCPQFLLDANPEANIVVTQRKFLLQLVLSVFPIHCLTIFSCLFLCSPPYQCHFHCRTSGSRTMPAEISGRTDRIPSSIGGCRQQ